ncbi:MAG: GWxTD domain-containing protein [Candidatus Zixiibacteriota bacterium]|nr:MAG: GWxTD domain-containing protein [candidate division Zixibacteria bacterium]
MRSITCVALFCLLMLPAADSIWGQTDFGYLDESETFFFVDWAAFREEAGEKFGVEIYYKIFTQALTFVRQTDQFRASYEIQVFLSNKINKQVTGTSLEEDYFVGSYAETQSTSDFLINKVPLSVYSGRYKLRIKLIDANSGSAFELEKDLKIPSRDQDRILFSDLQFIRHLADSTGESKFNRQGKLAIPSVSRSYGDFVPTLLFYYQIYDLPRESGRYVLTYRIEHLAQAFTRQETLDVTLEPGTFSAFDSVSLEDFPSGDYSLTMALVDRDRVKAKMEGWFQVDWSLLNQLKNDYLKAIEQLRFVASSSAMKELKEAPEEERLERWLAFWKTKDPTPGTPENEVRDEYYRRLRYVNQNLSVRTREGWETDMGRVYMIYGHPDDVEKHPFDREVRAFQRWYYYKQNRVFLFMDRGDGEYELQPPYDGKTQFDRY